MSKVQDNDETESTIPALEKPEFKSDIPPHLLANASENEKYVLEQLSMVMQYVRWSSQVEVDTNHQVRKTNGRVIKLERWKEMFSSWWALLLAILTIVGGMAGLVEVIKFLSSQ